MNSANLAALPADITLQILEHVAGPKNDWQQGWPALVHDIPEGESLKDIQNVRLTCRSLSQIAIHILFPVLRVAVNHRSIDAFEQMSKNLHIANQVQGVQVTVAAFSSVMAADIGSFKDKQLTQVREAFSRLEWEMEFRLEEEADKSEDDQSEDVKEYFRIDGLFHTLRDVWNRIAPTDSARNDIEGPLDATTTNTTKLTGSKFGAVLLSSYKEYARRYREQVDCLNDAETMTRLVKAVARLKCKGKIRFSEDVPSALTTFGYDLLIAELLENQRALSQALIQPHTWQDLYSDRGEPETEMVRLISQFPIALAAAGMPCTELYLSCFPRFNGFQHLLTSEGQTSAELETQLKTAFQHLQIFDFGYRGMNYKQIREKPISEPDLSYIRAYLAAAVASPQLRELRINMNPYGLCFGQGTQDEPQFRLGASVLHSLASRLLTRVTVSNFDATSDELEPFLSRLGATLRWLYVWGVNLREGSWAPLLDAMRGSTAQRCQDGLCWSGLTMVSGAEFGPDRTKDLDIFTSTRKERAEALRTPLPIKKAKAYIRGKRSTNPLRIVGDDPESCITDDSDIHPSSDSDSNGDDDDDGDRF
ncbi:hypothetical protein NLG97_g7607 [Lecanicillium saksenae]|uniref:Uncharacterized protein n=1 Tax=Lecanicillium saksenae TaxID=468837 RepID=A0ACC1QLD7_9HYPO|nr:hypothetical protein NLG97_g7607 [Lecanicillium saksenae]